MAGGDPGVSVGAGPEQAESEASVAETVGMTESSATERAAGAGLSRDQAVWLVLWRHGQTDWNVQRRFQGQSDTPLNSAGHEQARRAARYIAALRPAAIFSSDLIRASATAEALARLTGLSVQLDKDLRERNGGSWEG